MKDEDRKVLREFWQENYVDKKTRFCVLCGNTGIVKTSPVSNDGIQLDK